MNILVLHGPNLNLLGERDTKQYGTLTLRELNQQIRKLASTHKISLKIYQSNHEGRLIDLLQQNRKWADYVLLNGGGYTHTSVALRDAVESIQVPTIEVHLSNIKTRESFRKKSLLKAVCVKTFMGKKEISYLNAIEYARKEFSHGR